MNEWENHTMGTDTCVICTDFIGPEQMKLERAVIKPILGVDNKVVIPAGLHFFHEQCWISFDCEERKAWENKA